MHGSRERIVLFRHDPIQDRNVMEKRVLSIIVPIYNLGNALAKCLDAILCQTYRDFELILVDDGSIDGSLSVCQKYQEKDERIRIFHQENKGAASARNLGLDNANGSYVSFVDGDDLIEPEMIEKLMNGLIQSDADISCCQMDRITDEGKHVVSFQAIKGLYDPDDVVSRFFEEGFIKECMYGAYNKMFRRSCIGSTRFQPYKYGEDFLFVFETLTKAKTVFIDDYIGYHYVERKGSVTKSTFSLGRLDYVKAARQVERYCSEFFPPYLPLAQHLVYRHVLITVRQLVQYEMGNRQKAYIKAEKKYLKDNADQLSGLPFQFRLNYWLVMYCPFLIRKILAIRNKFH